MSGLSTEITEAEYRPGNAQENHSDKYPGVYKTGDVVKMDVRSSAGLPTVYVDVVRSGQTVLTKWLDVKDGKADYALDLPQSLFGTLEIHAYQMLASGEIIRDARVVYVQPADGLKITRT